MVASMQKAYYWVLHSGPIAVLNYLEPVMAQRGALFAPGDFHHL
jgi:hypothetical protein